MVREVVSAVAAEVSEPGPAREVPVPATPEASEAEKTAVRTNALSSPTTFRPSPAVSAGNTAPFGQRLRTFKILSGTPKWYCSLI